MKTKNITFKKVSEIIAYHKDNKMNIAYNYTFSPIIKETEKAVCVLGSKLSDGYANKSCQVWLPKSQVQIVTNDVFTDEIATAIVIPFWLIAQNLDKGIEI